ncbi:MAG: type IV toxin-antitoxin system AbiEi family antitoxin domain-containing protein [Bacilli bacterium]
MSNEEKIIEIIKKNNGLVTTKKIDDMSIPKVTLSRLVKKGIIQRQKRGLYVFSNTFGDEYYEIIYNAKNAVFSYLTALYFHNLCERVPMNYDVTVSYNYTGSLTKNDDVTLHYVKPEILDMGRIKIKSPQGQIIECYDIERCLCDIFKDKSKIYSEYIKYAFTEYYKIQKNNTFKLYQYAKKLNIEKEINEYLEVLL